MTKTWTHRACLGMALGLTLVFLSSVARFYHPGTGFTALIGFPEGADDQAPALRGLPHYQYPAWASYDGQFYAQRALDPLLRDPQVDRGMDSAPFRARRILFSWTAYVLGFGRPAWILEVFALQNVASWLLLAWLVTRWLPLRSPRALSLWFACLFSHGLLWSVRFALLDGPSLLLTMLAVRAAEQGRRGLSGTIAGINGLGRETNVLGALAQPPPASLRDAFRLVGALALVALPLLIWEDYLRSIYRSTIFADTGQLAIPGTAVMSTVARLVKATRTAGVFSVPGLQLGIVVSVVVQAVYVVVRPRPDVPCWRVAAGYIVLMLLINRVLWDPVTGAITRVMLPLTVSFNILLQRETSAARFWAWFVAGNLHVLASFQVMPFV